MSEDIVNSDEISLNNTDNVPLETIESDRIYNKHVLNCLDTDTGYDSCNSDSYDSEPCGSPVVGLFRHKSIDLLQKQHSGPISTLNNIDDIEDVDLDEVCNIPMCPKHGFKLRNLNSDRLRSGSACSTSSAESDTRNRTLSRSSSRSSIVLAKMSGDITAECIMKKYKNKPRTITSIKKNKK
jgi:hypothetical protein